MRATSFHLSTLKEAPADAEVTSQKLMLRAGMIRKAAAGIYSYMPLGLRVIRKIERIVRDEMNRAGGIELTMPMVQPGELWQESGRWEKMGPELLRMQDRHGRDFALQPTSEEVVTEIARQELKSYRQLPKNFYQIQIKFRDERRPRFGIMRGREFIMKDAYSFDRDEAGASASYDNMFQAYCAIFDRLGLHYRAVAADSGAIGGDRSSEFQVIADAGEDAIVYCPTSTYAANIELAEAVGLIEVRKSPSEAMQKQSTPGIQTCGAVAEWLHLPLEKTVKSIVLATDDATGKTTIWLALIRGDHTLNEVKIGKIEGLRAGFRFATEAEILAHFGSVPGYIGPINPVKPVRIVADRTVAHMADFVCGANEEDFHFTGVNWVRDLPEPDLVADLRNVVEGDPSPDGQGVLAIQRGIEVGHVFYLGTRYSQAMNATFLDEDGRSKHFEMGSYGIGITRILGAAIEQANDERGMIWPEAIAPFEVVICPIGWGKSETVRTAAEKLYCTFIEAGVDVILDDRDERPGVMFADWELIGVPHRITIGERGLREGMVEYQSRRETESVRIPADEGASHVLNLLRRSR